MVLLIHKYVYVITNTWLISMLVIEKRANEKEILQMTFLNAWRKAEYFDSNFNEGYSLEFNWECAIID